MGDATKMGRIDAGLWVATLALACGAPAARADAPPADVDLGALLSDVDRAHGAAANGLTYRTHVKSELTDGRVVERTYEVKAQGAAALGVVVAPPANVGDKVLMIGAKVWQRPARSSMPSIVPPADRLTGLACVGDLISTVYATRYEAKLRGLEGSGADAAYVLDLTATSPDVPFEAARLWVDKAHRRATKAVFTTKDGKPLRTVTFGYGLTVGRGKDAFTMVDHMTVTDDEAKSFRAEVRFEAPKPAAIPKDALAFGVLLQATPAP
jgi:hypothetical protein